MVATVIDHEHVWKVNAWGIAWVQEFCAVCFETRQRDRERGERFSRYGEPPLPTSTRLDP